MFKHFVIDTIIIIIIIIIKIIRIIILYLMSSLTVGSCRLGWTFYTILVKNTANALNRLRIPIAGGRLLGLYDKHSEELNKGLNEKKLQLMVRAGLEYGIPDFKSGIITTWPPILYQTLKFFPLCWFKLTLEQQLDQSNLFCFELTP